MTIDIYELARRANQAEQADGFERCTVESESDRELAFQFNTAENAHRFLMAREALDMEAWISEKSESVVIVRQPS